MFVFRGGRGVFPFEVPLAAGVAERFAFRFSLLVTALAFRFRLAFEFPLAFSFPLGEGLFFGVGLGLAVGDVFAF